MSDLTAGVDFETYYHKTRYSVQVQGVRGYVEHPEFDAYMVSIYTSDGGEFAGHPSEFDFEEIKHYTWLSHNRGFDQAVYSQTMTNLGRPIVLPDQWHCTADMAGYCGLPRDLGSLLNHLYDLELDKGVRDRMSGVKWNALSPDQKAELIEYAMEDVRYLPKLWNDLKDQWPEMEREVSDMTIRMKYRGLPINATKLDKSIKDLGKKMREFEDDIPWWDRETAKNKTPLSPLALAKECKRVGIPAPTSRAKGNADAIAWQERYGKEHKFVSAMGNWNSANTLIQKLISLRERLIFPDPEDWAFQGSPPEWVDGDQAWMPYGMKYCGTHTRRDSGGDGWNVLNMNRAEVFGINIRNHIQAPKGFKFISSDYSQIEPRLLAWLVDDEEFLDRVRAGEDPYVSFGTITLGHTGPWTPEDRTIWKVMVLQLGYQSGWKKFQMIAETVYKLKLSNLEAKRLVAQYRSKNRKVVKFWSQMEKQVRACLESRGGTGTCEIQLPSGAIQYYRDLQGSTSLKATFAQERGFKQSSIYSGLIVENICQTVARDCMMDGYYRIEKAGIPIVLRIYDEFLALVREEEAEEKKEILEQIMNTPPEWAPDLPIAAEAKIIDFYTK